jgi:glycosyltransferase involved in cell wall biosynthesis
MSIDNNRYPKVLIIGETFRLNGGGGITLVNLFKGWNQDQLAIITERIHETSFQSGCKKFYRLGKSEIRMPFPFNFINKIPTSGDFSVSENKSKTLSQQIKPNIIQRIKFNIEDLYYKILILLGLTHAKYRISLSDSLLKWIKDFSPDIIYAQPFKYSDMVFAKELKEKTGLPLAIHLMDDSVSFLNTPNLFNFYWKKKINSTFKQLVNVSDIHLCISDAMAREYFNRYKKTFIPFRNPIEIEAWTPYVKQNWSSDKTQEVNIIYTGRLAVPNIHALYTFCQVVESLNSKGYHVKLSIYSIDSNPKFKELIKHLDSIRIFNSVPFDKIPELVTKFDIAFLPIDFTEKGMKYARYSISTKTSEYMISGVPILLFAPKQVALTLYAEENNCMYSVTENNLDTLADALEKLINDNQLREILAKKAFAIAKSDSDALVVREKFVKILTYNSPVNI